jgi:predicted restriction endonuclease
MVINDVKGRPYIETHHIISRSRNGKDDPDNMLIVCPNHHKMFALGSARIDLNTKTLYVNSQEVNWTNKHL